MRMRSKHSLILSIAVLLGSMVSVSGCTIFSEKYPSNTYENPDKDPDKKKEKVNYHALLKQFLERNKKAAQHLSKYHKNKEKDFNVVIVTTPANLDNLETTDPIGRLIGEQISSEITRHGYQVIEIKTRNTIKVHPKTGEFILSRNLEKIVKNHGAHYIIGGTFKHMKGGTFVSLKMISPRTHEIVSSYDYILPRLEVE